MKQSSWDKLKEKSTYHFDNTVVDKRKDVLFDLGHIDTDFSKEVKKIVKESLDAIGIVTGVIAAGQSRFYIMRMPSGRVIGFATMQPDAKHFIVTSTTAYRVPRVSQLAASLQANNISENLKTLIRLHSIAMPEEAQQMKEVLMNLKNKKK
jgi:hypothetical protein